MTRAAAADGNHWEDARDIPSSLALVLPLLLAYEVAVTWLDPPVRNGAEHAVAELLARVPTQVLEILRVGGLVAVVGATVVWLFRGPRRRWARPDLVLAEALVHALWLGPLVGLLVRGVLGFAGLSAPADVMPVGQQPPTWLPFLMSVGAGLWEELVFRLGLLGGLDLAGSSRRQWYERRTRATAR